MSDIIPSLGNFHEYVANLSAIFQSVGEDTLYSRLKASILLGEITVNTEYLPANAKIFSIMFLNKELAEATIQAVIGEKISIVAPMVEHRSDLFKAIHASIWLDVYLKGEDARVFTLDMQRLYLRTRSRNRNAYYGAKELAAQIVADGKYEKLKQVSITFIFEENTTPTAPPVSKIQFMDINTKEVYTDLITLYEVNLNKINDTQDLHEDLKILKDFLLIKTPSALCEFVKKYDTIFAQRLVTEYMHAILDDSVLLEIEGSEKFMIKLTEAALLEERQEGKAEGKAEGLTEGKAEGLTEGIAQGLAEGLTQGLAEGFDIALAVAKGLLHGISPKQLAEEYNRPLEDIEKIQRELTAV
ncbi:MAG: PD-(D/E)XK nuclease family transposase [Defluviitaleaceae bacterium]|nr:PD-(D/E)XK nuclease family transposase [Defluviitaleaceae bacterium]